MVVFTSWCPNSSWSVRISVPFSKAIVAKVCRREWHVTARNTPTRRAASPSTLPTVFSCACHRMRRPVSFSSMRFRPGRKYRQSQDRAAAGFLRANPPGRAKK